MDKKATEYKHKNLHSTYVKTYLVNNMQYPNNF